MLTEYIQASLKRAAYEILPDSEGFYGEISGFEGVWSNADTLEACREELREVLEGWILVRLRHGLALPVIDDLDLNEKTVPEEVA